MTSLDFLRKELVKTFYFTNANDERYGVNRERINGRVTTFEGQLCATTLIGLLYLVYDPSVESYKYILHVGVANQRPEDAEVDEDEEYEKAYINALTDPRVQFVIGDDYSQFEWKSFAEAIVNSQPKELVLTDEELSTYQYLDYYGAEYPCDYLYFELYKGRV